MRQIKMIAATLLLAVTVLSAAALAQTNGAQPAQAERPTFKKGASFTFKNWTGEWSYTYLGERDGLLVFEGKNRKTSWELFYTPDLNAVRSTRRGYEFENSPHYGGMSFPLYVGKSWEHHYTHSMRSGTIQRRIRAAVTAYETVAVPAGTFGAYRIEIENQRLDRPFPADETLWYAPDVGFVIKYSSREFRWEYELARFNRQ